MSVFPTGLCQPAGGSRFSMDSLLLPAFASQAMKVSPARLRNPGRAEAFGLEATDGFACVDLGCGCGASTIALSTLLSSSKVWGVDIAPENIDCARKNAVSHGDAGRLRFDVADAAELAGGTVPFCDMAICNPPYWEKGSGHATASELSETARREKGDELSFYKAARQLLVHKGRFFLIYPAARFLTLAERLGATGFGVRGVRLVRPFEGEDASRVLVEARKGVESDISFAPDLILYERDEEGRARPTDVAKALCPWIR